MSVVSLSRSSSRCDVSSVFGSRRPATSGTSVATQDIVCAISESRGMSSTVGLAFVNLSTAEVVLCQICDSQTYVRTIQKVLVFDPTEILVMGPAKDSKLLAIVRENVPQPTYTLLDRKFWSERLGHDYVERFALPGDLETIKVILGGSYFAACCFAAVFYHQWREKTCQ